MFLTLNIYATLQQKTYNTTYKLNIQHSKPQDDFIYSCCDFLHNTLTTYAVSRIRRNFQVEVFNQTIIKFLNTYPPSFMPSNIILTKRTLLNTEYHHLHHILQNYSLHDTFYLIFADEFFLLLGTCLVKSIF